MLEVAVGVVLNTAGEVLIAQRAAHRHQGGRWEFPGGKIEHGEPPEAALARELAEEVGLAIHDPQPLLTLEHAYPERSVRLRVYTVRQFSGEAHGREGQPLRWVAPDALADYTFPEANTPIIEALLTTRPTTP